MAKLFKKPKTFEEGQDLRERFIEAFGEDGTFIIAFRVGKDLVSTMCGTEEELKRMIVSMAERVEQISQE